MARTEESVASRPLVPCPREVPVCLTTSEIVDSIGNTPMILMQRASEEVGCRIYAKAEHLNPGGSIKDRIAHFLIEQAESRGDLRPESTILEVTSGNTGIGLSMVGAIKGYKVIVMMPQTVSLERRQMIESFVAELHLLQEIRSIQEAVARAMELTYQNRNVFLPSQFSNRDNPLCHELTTGPEILQQVDGKLDAFVMGVGTGGTLMGVGRALRAAGVPARIIAVEPDESAVLSGDPPGVHGIQGLADGFIPEIVERDEIDQIVRIPTERAREMALELGRKDGLLVGISSGANLLAAKQLARELGPGHTIVTVLPDRGERYLSLKGGDGTG